MEQPAHSCQDDEEKDGGIEKLNVALEKHTLKNQRHSEVLKK